MCANDGAINDRADLVDLQLKRFEDCLPLALLRPIVEAVVDRFPRAEALGKVAPGHTCFRPEEYGVDEQPISPRSLGARLLLRDDGLDAAPLLFAHRVSVHTDL